MYLSIVLIDTLTPDGILTSFEVKPKECGSFVSIDRYRDIHPEIFGNDLDLGGTRIYNSNKCSISRTDTHLRAFEVDNNKFSFQFEHMGIPVGYVNDIIRGHYNLVLPPGFRLTDFSIVDPYDRKHKDLNKKKKFRYNVIWDRECKVQLIEMSLESQRGTFSFIAYGSFVLVDVLVEYDFIEAEEYDWKVSYLTSCVQKDDGKKILVDEIVKKIDWVELKPTIFGIGININSILKDCIDVFRRKIE
jgi:hypothetical protein